MKTGTKIALGIGALVGGWVLYTKQQTGKWGIMIPGGTVIPSTAGLGDSVGPHYMSGYSPPPSFIPPEYTPNGPGPSRVHSFVPPGYYDPRSFFPG